MKNVLVRACSGGVYVALIVCCILAGNFWFTILTAFFSLTATFEFIRLTESRLGERITGAVRVFWWIYVIAIVLIGFMIINRSTYDFISPLLVFAFFAPFLCLCMAVFSKAKNILRITGEILTSIFYIALPLTALSTVYTLMLEQPLGLSSSSTLSRIPVLILVSFICIWINDTGAYCVGCTVGKHRMCERLSPKKSWEGFWGGIILVIIAMTIYAAVIHQNIIIYSLYGAFVGVLATVGDLFESLLKRTAGVKDSGSFIPGHGGILDRIDSLLFVSYGIIFVVITGVFM